MNEALVLVHPHEFWDDGVTKESTEEVLDHFDMDAFRVKEQEHDRKPYGGADRYTDVFEDTGTYMRNNKVMGGRLDENDAERLVEEYDRLFLGGGYTGACMSQTYQSLLQAADEDTDLEFHIVPEISFSKPTERCSDSFGNFIYTLEDLALQKSEYETLDGEETPGERRGADDFDILHSTVNGSGLHRFYDMEVTRLTPLQSENVEDITYLDRFMRGCQRIQDLLGELKKESIAYNVPWRNGGSTLLRSREIAEQYVEKPATLPIDINTDAGEAERESLVYDMQTESMMQQATDAVPNNARDKTVEELLNAALEG